MESTANLITDRHPHLRDSEARRQMLVRNAVASARVEGIVADERHLEGVVRQRKPRAAGPR